MKKIILAISFLSTVSFAGDAGCGLGSMIISKNSKLLQLFALTTNGSSFSQAFGITSGTSNCSASSIVMNDKQIEYFAESNQIDLTREMAQGQGEKLNTLAALYGCTDKTAFAKLTQGSFSQIVTHENIPAHEMVKNLTHAVTSNGVCGGI